MLKVILVLIASLALHGCLADVYESYGIKTVRNPADYNQVASGIEFEYNRHQARQKLTGPTVHPFSALGHAYFLRSNQDSHKEFPPIIQIYLFLIFDDWVYVDTAYSHGESLRLTEINRSVGTCGSYGGCTVYEEVAVGLDRDELKEYSITGFSFQVSGAGASVDFWIPPNYFRAFYNKLYPFDAISSQDVVG